MKPIQSFLFLLILSALQTLATEQNPAFYAVNQKDLKSLEKNLQKNPLTTELNQDGQTILHAAVLANNWKAVEMILKSKSTTINQTDNYGKTAMDYAVEYGHKKMVKKLYKNNGKVTSVDNANHAKKIITRPYKIFLGIIAVPLCIACLWISVQFIGFIQGGAWCGLGLTLGLGVTIPLVIPTIIAATKYKKHLSANLLLTESIA